MFEDRLVSSRRSRGGYSILEVVIVLGLLAIVAAIGWFGYATVTQNVRQGAVVVGAQGMDRGLRTLASRDPKNTYDHSDFVDLVDETVADIPPLPGTTSALVLDESTARAYTTSAVEFSDSLTIDACIAPTAWAGSDAQAIITKMGTNNTNSRVFGLYLNADGHLLLALRGSGGTSNSAVSPEVVPGIDGQALAVRARWSGVTNQATFYAGSCGSGDWDQLGASLPLSVSSSTLVENNHPINVGRGHPAAAGNQTRPLIGRIYDVVVRTGESNQVVLAPDFSTGGIVDETGAEWLLTGGASVEVPVAEPAVSPTDFCLTMTNQDYWVRLDYGASFSLVNPADIAVSGDVLTC